MLMLLLAVVVYIYDLPTGTVSLCLADSLDDLERRNVTLAEINKIFEYPQLSEPLI